MAAVQLPSVLVRLLMHPSSQDGTNLKPFVVVVSDLGFLRHSGVPISGRRLQMTLTPGPTFSYLPQPRPAFPMPEIPSHPVTAHQIITSIHYHHDDYYHEFTRS